MSDDDLPELSLSCAPTDEELAQQWLKTGGREPTPEEREADRRHFGVDTPREGGS